MITVGMAVAVAAILVIWGMSKGPFQGYSGKFWLAAVHEAEQSRVRLLCETDFHALSVAGREILDRAFPKEETSDGPRVSGLAPWPKGVRVPQIIEQLQPRGILLNKYGYLAIEMHGGMDHFGVRIYPEGFQVPYLGFSYGDRELADGLWYYDDGYCSNPEYDKRIDQLIEAYEAGSSI